MPLSFDPQQLPVIGIDSHLSPVDARHFDPAALRQRFRDPPVWLPERAVEARIDDRAPAEASVLIAIVPRPSPTVLLTQRTDHLTDHPGQISFPGGRVEPEDVDAAATALREAHEEIGLDPRYADVLGQLPTYTTGTGFIVTPVVASVRPGYGLSADPHEVAEVFEVPLDFLMNPANHRWHAVEVAGRRREFLSMPWSAVGVQTPAQRYFIWGATAAILRNFYRFLSA
jgi:8-oxo-dGTP pyrophosphatase MutT (NUDIX family)